MNTREKSDPFSCFPMKSATFLRINPLRVERLPALLARLQAEKGWPEEKEVHFMCENEPLTNQPWALRMYVGDVLPRRGEFNYVASIVPDTSRVNAEYYADTKVGAQAVRSSGNDTDRWGTHQELVAYLRSCI